MERISRRGLLVLGGLGAVAVASGGTGLLWTSARGNPAAGSALRQPEILRSAQGLLEVRLTAAAAAVEIDGTTVAALTYNRGLPGPTLAVRPGDLIRVAFENGLSTTTNLHTHGLHVSPLGAGDNPFVAIRPGDTFDYEYRLPANHPPGVYWYHPHHHGIAADQVFGGLYGAILVEDDDADASARERVVIISDISFGQGTIPVVAPMDRMFGREGDRVLVNGQLLPRMSAAPGETERWRVINACTSRYLRLRLDGQRMQLLGTDSGRFSSPVDIDEMRLSRRPARPVTAGFTRSSLRHGFQAPDAHPRDGPDGYELRDDVVHHRRKGLRSQPGRHRGIGRVHRGVDAEKYEPDGSSVPLARVADAGRRWR